MSRLLQSALLVLAVGLGATSCKTEYHEGCTYHSDCDDGFLCNDDNECEEVECTTSDDCEPGNYCGTRFECEPGCEGDSDCIAGEKCTDEHECKAYGCRTTELDCTYGEYCNTDSGECEKAPGEYCTSCDILGGGNECGPQADCFYTDGGACNSSSDCETGYECDYLNGAKVCYRAFCYETCNPNEDEPCPRGFQCGDVSGFGDYYCFADCDFMVDNGYL